MISVFGKQDKGSEDAASIVQSANSAEILVLAAVYSRSFSKTKLHQLTHGAMLGSGCLRDQFSILRNQGCQALIQLLRARDLPVNRYRM